MNYPTLRREWEVKVIDNEGLGEPGCVNPRFLVFPIAVYDQKW